MRRAFVILLALVMTASIFAVPVQAFQSVYQGPETRAISAAPSIYVNGNTASCNLTVSANTSSDYISATIKLYRDNSCISTWYRNANGYLFFSDEVTVLKGYTYTLKVDLTVNGQSFYVGDVSDSN